MEKVVVDEKKKAEWLERIPSEHRIPRVTSEEFFEKAYKSKTPCIVEGVGWKCMDWTPQILQEEFAAYDHYFRYGDGEAQEKRTFIRMGLNEFISKLFVEHDADSVEPPTTLPVPDSRTEKIPYARHIGPLRGRLFYEARVEALFPENVRGSVDFTKYLFVGPPKTKTNNHYDWSDNFSLCVKGIKHVALMPPNSERQMSNISDDLRRQLSEGDCFFVDDGPLALDLCTKQDGQIAMHEHPVLRTCEKLIYSPLFPGDIVFFPAHWFHYFHNHSSTISVTTQTKLRGKNEL